MSKKLMTKLSAGAAHAPVHMGASSLLAIAAGVVAVVGVSALHKRRLARDRDDALSGNTAANASSRGGSSSGNEAISTSHVMVGLLRVHVPQNWSDLVKNDVFLEKTISEVTGVLVVYVAGRNKHEIVNYTGELYNMAWDLACLKGKPQLDIRIVCGLPDESFATWDELLLLPELNAVFAEDELTDVQHMNATRAERDGLFAVAFHPLAMYTAKYFGHGASQYRYFEDETTTMATQDTVLLGGTFDHLHNGHKKLLSLAVSLCRTRLVIGITSPEMLRGKKHAHLIESIDARQRSVRAYVRLLKPRLQVEFVVLTDPFGPAIIEPAPAAIVASTETVVAMPKIMALRHERGLAPLDVYVCRRTDAATLSSSYIRERLATAASSVKA